jgi:hypothetical protein
VILTANGIKKINYKKNFKSVNYKGRLGGGVYTEAHLKFDENGIDSGTYLKARIKIFNHYRNATEIRYYGVVDPLSFENTKLGVSMSILGYEVYHTGSTMLEEANVTIPNVDVNATDINTTTQQKQKRREAKMKKAKETLDSLEEQPVLGLNKNKSITLAKEYGTTLFLGPIPIYVHAGVGGDVGFEINIGLEGLANIVGKITPYAKLGGYARAGLGAGFSIFKDVGVEFSAGAAGEMNLVSEELTSEISGEIEYVANGDYITSIKGTISEKIKHTFKGPNGKLKRYISYYGPSKKKISKFIHADGFFEKLAKFEELFHNWKQRYYSKTITDWSSYTKTKTLLDKSQTAFEIPLMATEDHIIFYDDYNCQGNDVGVFDSNYESDISCKDSMSCKNNKAKSVLIKKEVKPGTKIRVYDNPDKKTSKYDYTTIIVSSSGLSEDICINGFQHQTTNMEKSKGVRVLYHNVNHKRMLNGNISHIKVF